MGIQKKVLIFSVLAFLLLNVCTAEGKRITGTVVAVERGDLLQLNHEGQRIEVALYGIDCPDSSQPFGPEAQQFAYRLAYNKNVSVQVYHQEHESAVAGNVILPDNRILNHELLKKGLAYWDQQEEPGNPRLQTFQTLAREMGAGVWSSPAVIQKVEPIQPEGEKEKTTIRKTASPKQKASSKDMSWQLVLTILLATILLLIIIVLLFLLLKKTPAKTPVSEAPAKVPDEMISKAFDPTESQAEAIESSRKTIQDLLNSMAVFINGLVESSSVYSNQMDDHKNQIKNAMTKAGLEEIKRLLLLEISQIQEDNESHRKELSKANQTIQEQQKIMEEIRQDAQLDFLTKVANRRAFDSRLNEELERSKRYGGTFSLIMFDIDHFKQVNDNYSHMAGDKTLQLVAKLLQ